MTIYPEQEVCVTAHEGKEGTAVFIILSLR